MIIKPWRAKDTVHHQRWILLWFSFVRIRAAFRKRVPDWRERIEIGSRSSRKQKRRCRTKELLGWTEQPEEEKGHSYLLNYYSTIQLSRDFILWRKLHYSTYPKYNFWFAVKQLVSILTRDELFLGNIFFQQKQMKLINLIIPDNAYLKDCIWSGRRKEGDAFRALFDVVD